MSHLYEHAESAPAHAQLRLQACRTTQRHRQHATLTRSCMHEPRTLPLCPSFYAHKSRHPPHERNPALTRWPMARPRSPWTILAHPSFRGAHGPAGALVPCLKPTLKSRAQKAPLRSSAHSKQPPPRPRHSTASALVRAHNPPHGSACFKQTILRPHCSTIHALDLASSAPPALARQHSRARLRTAAAAAPRSGLRAARRWRSHGGRRTAATPARAQHAAYVMCVQLGWPHMGS